MSKVRVQLKIHGRVQGVFFRQSTVEMAKGIALTGRVWNRPDGTVAAIFEGESDKVRRAVDWCHHGPPSARVTRVQETPETWQGEFTSFEVVF